MLSRCLSLICASAAGLLLLAGCQSLRGPEPVGQTFVAPPGPIVRSGTIRAVPPIPQYGQPMYGQPQYGQPQYGDPQYGQPTYGQPPYGQSPNGRPSLPNAPGA